MLKVESGPRFAPAAPGAAPNVFLFRGSIPVSITWDREQRHAIARRLHPCSRKDFPSIVAWLIFRARSLLRMEGSARWTLNEQDRRLIRSLQEQHRDGVSVTIRPDKQGHADDSGARASHVPDLARHEWTNAPTVTLDDGAAALGAQLETAANEGGLAYVGTFRGVVERIEECVAERPQVAAAWIAAAIEHGQRCCEDWSDATRHQADALWVRLFRLAGSVPVKYGFPVALALVKAGARGELWSSACDAELAQLRNHPHAGMLESAQQLARLRGEDRQQRLDRMLGFCLSEEESAASRAEFLLLLALLLGADNLRKDLQTRTLLGRAAIDLARSGEPKALLGLGAQITNDTVAEGIELMLAQRPDCRAAWMRAWLAGGLLDPLRPKELPGRIDMLMRLLASRQADLPPDLRATVAEALTRLLTRMASERSPSLASVDLAAGVDLLERSLPREGSDLARRAREALRGLWTSPLPSGATAR